MDSLKGWWSSVLEIEGATTIIYPSILVVLVLVAYYVVQAFRNMAIGGSPASDDHLGTFRKMRDEGMIAPEEYKKVAKLVPLPDIESKDKALVEETGADALSEAAKAAIRKAALKKSAETPDEDEGQSTES